MSRNTNRTCISEVHVDRLYTLVCFGFCVAGVFFFLIFPFYLFLSANSSESWNKREVVVRHFTILLHSILKITLNVFKPHLVPTTVTLKIFSFFPNSKIKKKTWHFTQQFKLEVHYISLYILVKCLFGGVLWSFSSWRIFFITAQDLKRKVLHNIVKIKYQIPSARDNTVDWLPIFLHCFTTEFHWCVTETFMTKETVSNVEHADTGKLSHHWASLREPFVILMK